MVAKAAGTDPAGQIVTRPELLAIWGGAGFAIWILAALVLRGRKSGASEYVGAAVIAALWPPALALAFVVVVVVVLRDVAHTSTVLFEAFAAPVTDAVRGCIVRMAGGQPEDGHKRKKPPTRATIGFLRPEDDEEDE